MKTESISYVFIVGNSRSGTTMMSRVFGNHPKKSMHLMSSIFSEI